jgi:Ser/Thr protein kinase RdoA (MazF antagonist)
VNEATEFFYALTPERVLDAVEVGGRKCTGRFIVLNSYENRVYQLELDDGTFVVAKFYRPGRWSRDQILDEHEFIWDLDDAEIPMASPIELTPDETIGKLANIHFSVFPRIGGRAPDEMDDAQLERIGGLLARIHSVGRTDVAEHRCELTPRTYGHDDLALILDGGHLLPSHRPRYEEVARELLDAITPIFEPFLDSWQRIHGDAHLGNVLRTPAGFLFLDFDDMVMGPPVQDLWMLWGGRDAWATRRRDILLAGYESMADFDRSSLRLVEPLRALRYIHYTAWLAKRWEDPAFKIAFPDFGTEAYWTTRTGDLAEQLRLIREEEALRPALA